MCVGLFSQLAGDVVNKWFSRGNVDSGKRARIFTPIAFLGRFSLPDLKHFAYCSECHLTNCRAVVLLLWEIAHCRGAKKGRHYGDL